ncbi:MAG: hypothetical protein OZ919_01920 [Xanthomonadaceae bacterium]|nr:hypothetical protein [Xanthomonadaceae bacterium]
MVPDFPDFVISPELAVRVQDAGPAVAAPIDFGETSASWRERQYSAVRRLWLFLGFCFGIIDNSEPYLQRPDGIYLPFSSHTLIYPNFLAQLIDCFAQYGVWIDDHLALARHGKYRTRPVADGPTKDRTEPDVLAHASRTHIDLDDPSLTDHERLAAERIVASREKKLPGGCTMAEGFHLFTIACAGARQKELWICDPQGQWHSLVIPQSGTIDVSVRRGRGRTPPRDNVYIDRILPVSLADLAHGAELIIPHASSVPRPRPNECIRYESGAEQSITVIFLPDVEYQNDKA